MRLSVAALAAGAALALSGCAASASDQISAKVQQLAQAVGRHDYATICNQVLAPSLVAHLVSNGISCVEAMQVALQRVQQPVVSIGKIEIRGTRATAITLTVARGQRASLAAIELTKTAQGWRIASLGSPLTAGKTPG
jgi:outer membrane murein-binding lipoprotein Lpp